MTSPLPAKQSNRRNKAKTDQSQSRSLYVPPSSQELNPNVPLNMQPPNILPSFTKAQQSKKNTPSQQPAHGTQLCNDSRLSHQMALAVSAIQAYKSNQKLKFTMNLGQITKFSDSVAFSTSNIGVHTNEDDIYRSAKLYVDKATLCCMIAQNIINTDRSSTDFSELQVLTDAEFYGHSNCREFANCFGSVHYSDRTYEVQYAKTLVYQLLTVASRYIRNLDQKQYSAFCQRFGFSVEQIQLFPAVAAIPTHMTFFDCLDESSDYVRYIAELTYDSNATQRFKVGGIESNFVQVLDFAFLAKLDLLLPGLKRPIVQSNPLYAKYAPFATDHVAAMRDAQALRRVGFQRFKDTITPDKLQIVVPIVQQITRSMKQDIEQSIFFTQPVKQTFSTFKPSFTGKSFVHTQSREVHHEIPHLTDVILGNIASICSKVENVSHFKLTVQNSDEFERNYIDKFKLSK